MSLDIWTCTEILHSGKSIVKQVLGDFSSLLNLTDIKSGVFETKKMKNLGCTLGTREQRQSIPVEEAL